jgi:hypothetical protein
MARKIKTIKTEWDRIATAYEKLATRTQRALNHTLEHYVQHGDLSLFQYASDTLKGKGAHRRAMIQWVEKWARATMQQDGTFKKKAGADHTKIDLDKAAASNYYEDDKADGRTGKDTKAFNFYGRIKSLIKQAGEMDTEYQSNPSAFKSAPVTPMAQDAKMLEEMLTRWEMIKDIDKPQPKADKALFTGNHPATEVKAA